jgi:transcriptional regulator with XRE-family HTH domain
MEKPKAQYAAIAERLEIVRLGFSELSKKDWAAKHGFNQTQYQNWSSGERRITVDAAERLCNDYGLSLDFIYRGRIDGLSDTARKVVLSARPTA